jgi:hypothetical protein
MTAIDLGAYREMFAVAGALQRFMDLCNEGYTVGWEITEPLEQRGLIVCRKVKKADLEEPFAADRGIEKGGIIFELTASGRALWDAMQADTPSPRTAGKD